MAKLAPKIAVVLVVLVAIVAAATVWLRSALPTISGTVDVDGIAQNVTIRRTEDGVPSITAETFHDAWFGLGYVHAQNRLWQLETGRRYALGRLSEILGEGLVDTDARQRRYRLQELAKRQYQILTEETRAAFDAYGKGVNAFIKSHDGVWPLEFMVLGIDPLPWQSWHGLLWGRQMALRLSGRQRGDFERQRLLDVFGPGHYRDLWQNERTDAPDASGASIEIGIAPEPESLGASNAWAVAPARSAGNGALLAGDPHLGLQLPNIWYLARLRVGGHVVEGATAPGTPFVILGRTETFAWSLTSNEADLIDLVRVEGRDVVRSELAEISIGNGNVRRVRVAETAVGPVISGSLLENTVAADADGVALHTTALLVDDRTPDAFQMLNRKANVEDALAALRLFGAPLFNVIMADRRGEIGHAQAGRIPIRTRHDGRTMTPSPDLAWQKTYNAADLPVLRNPKSGYVANANERPAAMARLPFPVYGKWADPARRARIDEMLGNAPVADIKLMRRMQLDARDASWPVWRSRLAKIDFERADVREAQNLLMAWDGRMGIDNPAPFLFASWLEKVEDQLMADERKALSGVGIPTPPPTRLLDWIDSASPWCLDVETGNPTCDDALRRGFVSAVDATRRALGDNMTTWRWGAAHKADFKNLLLTRLPVIGGWFDRSIETPGGDRTLNRGAHVGGSAGTSSYTHVHGAMFRAVHDLGPDGTSHYAIALGQSGNPMSPHYDDLLTGWRDGRYISFDAPVRATMTLRPRGNAQNR